MKEHIKDILIKILIVLGITFLFIISQRAINFQPSDIGIVFPKARPSEVKIPVIINPLCDTTEKIKWKSICYGNSTVSIKVKRGKNILLTSPDGLIWTTRVVGNSEFIVFDNSKW